MDSKGGILKFWRSERLAANLGEEGRVGHCSRELERQRKNSEFDSRFPRKSSRGVCLLRASMAALKITLTPPLEAENALKTSLREAFESQITSLRPPFSLAIPSPDQYTLLNRAILHGVLTEPQFAKTHIKHLHAIVTDGYATFVTLLLVNHLYPKLLTSVKTQLLWLTDQTVCVLGIGYDAVLISLV
ncbi:hypothetical protein LR48_Vigan102s000300 [Vigna angularis]|uniref:Integrator complex subunit 3 N-terminal domain-containing protein n=1 Tax=Phaseolus angularis TaxID=3914 RepID=A0A0L9T417_PHAAN|nr:hypothetical protein LR48_Vigan102s000300 [Vigna angularis]